MIMRLIHTSLLISARVLLLGILVGLTSCSFTKENTEVNKNPMFQLVILDEQIKIFPRGLGQDWQTAWPVLQSAYPSNTAYIINESDIESYNWSEQIITLTAQASAAVLQTYNPPSVDCQKGNNKKVCLLSRAFVVVYDGAPLYGGIFWVDYTATSFQYPIIYPMLSPEGSLTFTVRPHTSLTGMFGSDDWILIKDERIMSLFAELGTLTK